MKTTKWCFTVNENARIFYGGLEAFFDVTVGLKYICGQLEKASTGQIHFQGYLQLAKSQRLSWLKRNIDSGAHFEPQKASCNDDARNYCMKSDTQEEPFIEFGTYAKGRGSRTDLLKFKDAVKSGQTRKQLMDEHYKIFARYRHFYSTIKEIYAPDPKGKERKVSIYFGTPGTGKTTKAVSHEDMWKQPLGSNKWFNGYDGQSVALLDDFAGRMNKVPLLDLLRLTDRYPEFVETKGGYTWWTPDHIIMTTNYHPRSWYNWNNREPSYLALQRRVTEVIEFTEQGESPVDVEVFFQDKDLWPTQYYQDSEMRN